jgi:hypothetical protein
MYIGERTTFAEAYGIKKKKRAAIGNVLGNIARTRETNWERDRNVRRTHCK